jgi:hypothetical protein
LVGFAASYKVGGLFWVLVVFDKLLNVTSFGLYFELGFGLSQEVRIKGFLLFLGFDDNFLLDDGPMIFNIIEFK